MRGSRRLDGVPEYLSTRLMRTVAEARARGVDVISLGIGDPDTPPPLELRRAIGAHALRDELHVYPSNLGIAPLREAVAAHYRMRFGVELDPVTEVMPLLGAKEGLAHLCLAQLDPGDVALVADPGYPVYYGGPALAGGEAVGLPLRDENGFLPDLDDIDEAMSRRAGLLICGYPNNPTGAVADVAFFERLARWGAKRGVPI
jgi:LL-diaminopimelate aminotransferase